MHVPMVMSAGTSSAHPVVELMGVPPGLSSLECAQTTTIHGDSSGEVREVWENKE